MGPGGVDAAVVEDDDVVGVADGFEAVGDEQAGAAPSGGQEFPGDAGLGAFVHGAGGLVEEEDRGVGEQGAGQGEALALAAGEGGAAFADHRVVPVGEPGQLLVDAGGAGGLVELGRGGGGAGEAEVVGDGGAEEVGVLGDHGDAPAERVQPVRGGVQAADGDPPGVGVALAEQQAQQGGLPGAGGADQGGDASGRGGEGDGREGGAGPARVGEVDVLETDFGGRGPAGGGGALVGDAALGVAQRGDAVDGRQPQVPGVPLAGEVADRAEALGGQHQQQVGAGRGGAPGGGCGAGDEDGGDGAALHGEVGEAGVGEGDPHLGHGGPVQRGRSPFQPGPGAADGACGAQGRHPLEGLQVIGGERLVGVPVRAAPAGEEPVPEAGPGERQQEGGGECGNGVRLDEGDGDQQQGREGAGDDQVGQVAGDVRVHALDAVDEGGPDRSRPGSGERARAGAAEVGEEVVAEADADQGSGADGQQPLGAAEQRAGQYDGGHGGEQRGQPGRLAPGDAGEDEGEQHRLPDVGGADQGEQGGGPGQWQGGGPGGAPQFGGRDHRGYVSPGGVRWSGAGRGRRLIGRLPVPGRAGPSRVPGCPPARRRGPPVARSRRGGR